MRSSSFFGFSTIYVVFKEGVEFYWSRSRVLEKLGSLPERTLPAGVQPVLGPDATALGQVFWYTLEGRDQAGNPAGGWNLDELRSLQDWHVRYALMSADGVSEVASIGGFVREYQVDVDPDAMRAHRVSLDEVFRAVRGSNLEVGARVIEINNAEYFVRGLGWIEDVSDLEESVIKSVDDVPIRIKDVAHVALGPALRRGALDKGGAEAVGGVVVARYGENPLQTIENVKAKIAEIAPGLPRRVLDDGTVSQVTVVPFYDRSGLIHETLGTLETAISDEILVTIIVVLFLLVHLRSSALIAASLPVAVLFTFGLMWLFGVDANIVALSGIAIAIGTIVDMGVILCENLLERLDAAPRDAPRLQVVLDATLEVGSAVLTAVLHDGDRLPAGLLHDRRGGQALPAPGLHQDLRARRLAPRRALRPAGPGPPALPGDRGSARAGLAQPRRSAARHAGRVALRAERAGHPLGGRAPGDALGATRSRARSAAQPLLRPGGPPRPAVRLRALPADLRADPALVPRAQAALPLAAGRPGRVRRDRVAGAGPHPRLRAGDRARDDVLEAGEPRLPGARQGVHAAPGRGRLPVHAHPRCRTRRWARRSTCCRSSTARSRACPRSSWRWARSAASRAPWIRRRSRWWRRSSTTRPSTSSTRTADGCGSRSTGSATPFFATSAARSFRTRTAAPTATGGRRSRAPTTSGARSCAPPSSWGRSRRPELQPIAARLVMLSSGMRSPLGVKVKGPSLAAIEAVGLEIEALLKQVPAVNAEATFADRVVGKPYLEIDVDRRAAGRYGLSIAEVQDVIEIALGGRRITTTVEGARALTRCACGTSVSCATRSRAWRRCWCPPPAARRFPSASSRRSASPAGRR